MRIFASFRSVISALFHRSPVESEIEEELRAHIQDGANDLKRSGVPRAKPSDGPGSSSAAIRSPRKNAAKPRARISLKP